MPEKTSNIKMYKEDDWIAQVEIIKNNSNDEWERYALKVISTIQNSKIYVTAMNGDIFEVEQQRGMHLWRLN